MKQVEDRSLRADGEAADGGTRSRIEQAALDLFFERGYRATTMRDIATACGITPGAVYNHFVSKDSILTSLITRVHEAMEHDMAAAEESVGTDPRARLAALTRAHALLHTRYRKDARIANAEVLTIPEPARTEVVDLRRRVREMVKRAIQDGIAAGVFVDVDVFVTQAAILNMNIRIADWFQPGGRLSADEVAEMHSALALRMVGAHEETA